MPEIARERRIDVSDLEPPEPMEQVLLALDVLSDGEFLHMIHRREPLLLYPALRQRGFSFVTTFDRDHQCEVFIWRDGDAVAENACQTYEGVPGQ